jgi:mRNA interferase MazF
MPARCFRGTVVEVTPDPSLGREMAKTRPCVVVQNDIANQHSQLTIVAAITGAEHLKKPSPVYVEVRKGQGGLNKDSVVLCNQIRTVDESRLGKVLGAFDRSTMARVDTALRLSLALDWAP